MDPGYEFINGHKQRKKTFSWRSILQKTDRQGRFPDIGYDVIPNYGPFQGDSTAGNDKIFLTQKTPFRTLGTPKQGPIHSMALPGRYAIKKRSPIILFGLLILLSVYACGHGDARDSDSDGLSDTDEIQTYGTDPNLADTDSDGLNDGEEASVYGTDPRNPDTDGDQIPDGAEGFLSFRINNEIKSSVSICPVSENGVVTIFTPKGSDPAGQIEIPAGISPTYRLNLAAIGGLGIQVNLWYWAREPDIPIQKGPPQNPDNSGDQFIFTANCEFTVQDAYFGKGRKTSRIASVSSKMDHGTCVITIAPNSHTGCVTQRCCAPPLSGWEDVCRQGDYYKSVCTPP